MILSIVVYMYIGLGPSIFKTTRVTLKLCSHISGRLKKSKQVQ